MTEKTDSKNIVAFNSVNDLKTVLAANYRKQIENFFGDEKRALRFLSGVVSAVQRNPKLLECTPVSVINSFMTMAQLELMPSDVSGEAYVLPYNNKKKQTDEEGKVKWIAVMEAQFQLGYQGLVTLFYRAGARSIVSEIVREKDEFSYINGVIRHEPDVFSDDRGKARGAYCIVELHSGSFVSKAMSAKEILGIGKKFSKSFSSDHTPWNEANDPQLWMWRKTVLKQLAKLVPKNERLVQAIAEDNRDSTIGDRMKLAEGASASLTMGNALRNHAENNNQEKEDGTPPEGPDTDAGAEGYEEESGE